MSTFETVEVPFILAGNRQCLSDVQIVQQPWLRDFIEQFKHCFEYDTLRSVHWYMPQ